MSPNRKEGEKSVMGMTREEAIEIFETKKQFEPENEDVYEMAIKALEQEPCEDAISKQDTLKTIIKHLGIRSEEYLLPAEETIYKVVKNMPPVIPQQRVGKWIMKHRTYNKVKHYTGQDEMGETHTISVLERYEVDEPYCSKCGKLAGDTSQDFCCACGAKMERSDKE